MCLSEEVSDPLELELQRGGLRAHVNEWVLGIEQVLYKNKRCSSLLSRLEPLHDYSTPHSDLERSHSIRLYTFSIHLGAKSGLSGTVHS